MQKKHKYEPKPQTLLDTARWRISPEARSKINDYLEWLEKKKRGLEKRHNDK